MALIHHEERMRKQRALKAKKKKEKESMPPKEKEKHDLVVENNILRTLLEVSQKKQFFTKPKSFLPVKEQYKHPNWQRMRLLIMVRDEFKCTKCGDGDSMLHVHHLKYTKGDYIWNVSPEHLITLCDSCHNKEHGKKPRRRKRKLKKN